MRFLVTALILGLASLAQAAESEHKHGEAKFAVEYSWSLSISDDKLGRDTEEEDAFKIRSMKQGFDAEVDFEKHVGGVDVDVSYNLLNGLESATATAELPRSYLSLEVGKGALAFGGWQEYSSPYLSYHKPFPTYAPMARVFAPIEGVGELSLMVTKDVMEGDDDKRWHNDDNSLIGLLQYHGDFGMVSPLLQFSMYDYAGDDGWQSWLMAAGVKLAMRGVTMHFDYVHDNRKNKDEDKKNDASTTVYRTYTGGVYFKHGMLAPWASISMLMSANDDDRYDNIDGNFITPSEEAGEDYNKMLAAAFGEGASYGDLKDYQKYSTNMMVFAAGADIYCMDDDTLVPYVSYKLRMHKLDPRWDEEDSDTEDQMSHTISIGIAGEV